MRDAVRYALGGVETTACERKIKTRVGERLIETRVLNVDFPIRFHRFTGRTRERAMETRLRAKK